MCDIDEPCPVCGVRSPEVHAALLHATPRGDMPCCGSLIEPLRVTVQYKITRQAEQRDTRLAEITEQRDAAQQEVERLGGFLAGMQDVLRELRRRLARADVVDEKWNDPDTYGRTDPVTWDEVCPQPITPQSYEMLAREVWDAVALDRHSGSIVIGLDQVKTILAAVHRIQHRQQP